MTTTPVDQHQDDSDLFFTPKIPRANVEGLALGAGISTDLNGSSFDSPFTEGVEAFGGGILTYAVYQSLLTFFTLEPAVKAGTITRGQQLHQVQSTAWEATKGSAVAIAAVSIVLGVFPFLAPVAGITAIVGGVVAGGRLISTVMTAYSPQQKEVLRQKAEEAGVNLDRWLSNDDGTSTSPVGA